MDNGKRILVTFGRSDPLHLTEATHEMLGDTADYVWGPDFGRDKPGWAHPCGRLTAILDLYDVVYCGHGTTLLEATAAGCEVMVLGRVNPIEFFVAWSGAHLDHSGHEVRWWEPGVMAAMHREIVNRRFPPPTRGVEGGVWVGGASWVHQGA